MFEFEPILNLFDLDGATGFRIDGDPGGWSVGYADINGDGFDDVIIGSHWADDNGATFVVYGKADGHAPIFDLTDLDGSNGFRIDAEAAGEFGGRDISGAGDVNGDGIDDLIIGDLGTNTENGFDSGASYVVFGSVDGFPASMNLSNLDGSNGFRLEGASQWENSGASVSAAGDINGDGYDDIIIAGSTAVHVVFGRPDGFAPTMVLDTLDGANGFRIDGSPTFGPISINVSSAGDINNDGFDDVIIGTPGASPNGDISGAAYVIFGKADGFGPSMNLSSLDGTNGFRLDGVSENNFTGSDVSSAGDVNGDGYDDLLIGANSADPNGANSGSVYVVFGKADGFDASINLSSLNGLNGFRADGEGKGEAVGQSVSAAGDINGDGFDDILIGGSSAYVVFGKAGGFDATMDLSSLDGTTGFRLDGGGNVSSAGDTNGDGFDDLIIRAGGDGPTFVVFGRAPTEAVVRVGSAASQQISGGIGDDILSGLGGDDRLIGNGGNDTLIGGVGADVLRGNAGIDTASYEGSLAGVTVKLWNRSASGGDAAGDVLFGIENLVGSDQNDLLQGDSGVNRLEGGAGDDELFGGRGDDILIGGAGADLLRGHTGIDTASYEDSAAGVTVKLWKGTASGGDAAGDVLFGIENLIGSDQNDLLQGDSGVNRLEGGAGDDDLFGGGGDDVLVGGTGADLLRGHSGIDTASYEGSSAGVTVKLWKGTASGGDAAGDTLFGIENLLGSSNNDVLQGNSANNRLEGGAGDDDLFGGSGDDILVGGTGADLLRGHTGIDTASYEGSSAAVSVNLANGNISGGDAQGDSLLGIENLIGSDHGDRLVGTSGANRLQGGGGNDRLTGGRGDDTIIGGTGNDILTGGLGADTFVFDGTWGDDTVKDFADGLDLLDLSGSGLGFGDLTISQSGSDTLIEDAFGNSITLTNITATDITADDFLF